MSHAKDITLSGIARESERGTTEYLWIFTSNALVAGVLFTSKYF